MNWVVALPQVNHPITPWCFIGNAHSNHALIVHFAHTLVRNWRFLVRLTILSSSFLLETSLHYVHVGWQRLNFRDHLDIQLYTYNCYIDKLKSKHFTLLHLPKAAGKAKQAAKHSLEQLLCADKEILCAERMPLVAAWRAAHQTRDRRQRRQRQWWRRKWWREQTWSAE